MYVSKETGGEPLWPWTANRGVASHARADRIDAVAGRGAARHTGAGVARRQAHHERMRDERAREAAAGNAELPPEDDAVEMVSAAQLLDSVAEAGPNYTLLRSKETTGEAATWKTPGIPGKYPVCCRFSRFRLRFCPRPALRLTQLSGKLESWLPEWSSKLSGFPWKFPETKSAGDPLVFLVPETCTFSNVYVLLAYWEKRRGGCVL